VDVCVSSGFQAVNTPQYDPMDDIFISTYWAMSGERCDENVLVLWHEFPVNPDNLP
jgi:hypothetical protein